ncbi:MAG: SMODS domain-containing nucleotidyltransferase [Candidatus Limnocylindria bacterium]
MYLHDAFVAFLGKINPNEKDVDVAKKAHEDVRAYLASDEGLRAKYVNSYVAGSYQRQTAISPVKDVDVVCLTTYTKADQPTAVLNELRRVLAKKYELDNTVTNRRSILVKIEGTHLTMDIIPAIPTGGTKDQIWVPDRGLQAWIRSHPYGHIELATKRNQESAEIGDRRQYLSVVKMMRWFRHEQLETRRHPKGFIVEVLCLELAPTNAKEWAEAVRATMDSIGATYGLHRIRKTAPELDDPALPGEKIRTQMGAADFATLLDEVDGARATLKAAIDSEDNTEAAKLYRKVFGDAFPVGDGSGGKGAAAVFARSERNVRSSPTFA